MNFDEMILEAAKSIMTASSALVRAANAAQRELIDQGKVAKRPLTSSADGQWSEGLISAARLVAAATHSLVEAAQNLVTGRGTEAMLISAAKQVATSTTQLLMACKVKSDPTSRVGQRLQEAGNAVIKATDNLVQSAQKVIEGEEEITLKVNKNMVEGMAQILTAREKVLLMERRLEEARKELTATRLAQNHSRAAAGYVTDESDFEGRNVSAASRDGRFNTPSPVNMSRSANFSPPTPNRSFISNAEHTVNNSSMQSFEKRSNNLLLSNATPKPYNSSMLSSSTPSPQPPMSPVQNRSYETAVITNPNLKSTFDKSKFESCIQDLNEKTYGKGSPSGSTFSTFKTMSSSSTGPGEIKPNYEGYTTRSA